MKSENFRLVPEEGPAFEAQLTRDDIQAYEDHHIVLKGNRAYRVRETKAEIKQKLGLDGDGSLP
jgi:hypothetical protein